MSELTRGIVHRLAAAMREKRLTRRHLALRAGLSDGTVRRVLNGHDMRLSTLIAIARVVGLDPASLLAPTSSSFSA